MNYMDEKGKVEEVVAGQVPTGGVEDGATKRHPSANIEEVVPPSPDVPMPNVGQASEDVSTNDEMPPRKDIWSRNGSIREPVAIDPAIAREMPSAANTMRYLLRKGSRRYMLVYLNKEILWMLAKLDLLGVRKKTSSSLIKAILVKFVQEEFDRRFPGERESLAKMTAEEIDEFYIADAEPHLARIESEVSASTSQTQQQQQ